MFARVASMPIGEEQAEDGATERDLVDERGRRRVEERPRVRERVREADAVVAERGEGDRLGDPDARRRARPPKTAPSRSPELRKSSTSGFGWMTRIATPMADAQRRTSSAGGGSGAARRRGSPRSTRRSRTARRPGGASAGASRARRDERAERVDELVHDRAASPRPSGASPGTPPAGSRPTRPASCAACLPSASRAACACG